MSSIKLTLNIREQVIENAKKHARRQKVSPSKIVEHYVASISAGNPVNGSVSAWTKDLAAVSKPTARFDHKVGYEGNLAEKYWRE